MSIERKKKRPFNAYIFAQQPDNLVFKDIEPSEFAKKIMNKVLVDTKRWGKYFILCKWIIRDIQKDKLNSERNK